MENRLRDIKLKIERVLLKYTDLLQEHNSLLLENQEIKSQLEALKLKNDQVEQKNIELADVVQDLTEQINQLSQNSSNSSNSNSSGNVEINQPIVESQKVQNIDLFSSSNNDELQLNDELKEQIESLEIRINSLKGDNDLLRMNLSRKDAFILQLESEKRQLKIKISDLEEEIALKENTIEIQKNTLNDLKEQNKLIKLAKEMSPDKSDNHELKIKINELVRDIDRCIDLLND